MLNLTKAIRQSNRGISNLNRTTILMVQPTLSLPTLPITTNSTYKPKISNQAIQAQEQAQDINSISGPTTRNWLRNMTLLSLVQMIILGIASLEQGWISMQELVMLPIPSSLKANLGSIRMESWRLDIGLLRRIQI